MATEKLLIVTDAWPPQVSGVVTALKQFQEKLEKRGVSVTVVHPGLFARRIPFPLYPEVHIPFFPGRKMRELFATERPDYVHIAVEGPIGLAARKVCVENGIHFTTAYHSDFPRYLEHYVTLGTLLAPIALKYLRWFHSAGTKLFASNTDLAAMLTREGYRNIAITPLGVDVDRFVRDESRIPAAGQKLQHPVFVYFGRLAPEKNIEEFLGLGLPGTKLVIGDGPARDELESAFPDAVFVGYKKGQELVDWLSVCDVFVFPSRTETFGLAVVEALACGIPVATHKCLGPRDIITDGVDGKFGEDLREAALSCLTLSREKCREKALAFSWEKAAETFLEAVRSVPAEIPEVLH